MKPLVLRHLTIFLATLMMAFTISPVFAEQSEFTQGVQAYRKGSYAEAEQIFAQLHAQQPQETKATYYLAITSAQLGRFQQAKALYEEILLLDPNGEAGKLAQAGLKYLPPEHAPFDPPPRFQMGEEISAQTGASPQSALPNGMSMQDMMTWQMMMAQMSGGGGNQNGGGLNALPFMMMPPTGNPSDGPANPMSNLDPNVMSTMMMNQMMQNFNFSSDKQDN